MRKYVHRVGRTARAGRAGDAWTLVEEQEVWDMRVVCCHLIVFQARYFKTMLKQAEHLEKVRRMKVGEKDLAPLAVYYEVRTAIHCHNLVADPSIQGALAQLKESYSR